MARRTTVLTGLLKDERVGGRPEFCRLVNEVMDEAGDIYTARLNIRTSYYWTQNHIPAASGIWALAACIKAGITPDEAVEMVPELAAALAVARFVGAAKPRRAAKRRAA